MTRIQFNEKSENIMNQNLDMDNFYETATSEDLAVDFIINNKHQYSDNLKMFVNLFDSNFRAKYTSNIDAVKSIIHNSMLDIIL